MAVHNYDSVRDVVKAWVVKTKGRISAKRLLLAATAAGARLATFVGSSPKRRRRGGPSITEADARWCGNRATRWIDWGEIGPLLVFCAVLAWSRCRFVCFADNLGAESTMPALAACLDELGGVP